MSALFPDTDAKAETILIELLRAATAARKLELLGELNASARQLALMGLAARHPGATEMELRRLLADLLLGPELAVRVYGPLPGGATHAS